jgi:hypothetical protein
MVRGPAHDPDVSYGARPGPPYCFIKAIAASGLKHRHKVRCCAGSEPFRTPAALEIQLLEDFLANGREPRATCCIWHIYHFGNIRGR